MAPNAQHYVWAGGHFVLFLSATRYLLAWLTFRSSAYSKLYYLSYIGGLISYAIVCHKAYGSQATNNFRRLATDENAMYLALAIFWWISKPVPVSLIPFAIFSLFHVLTFTRTYILPQFLPPTPPATAGQPPQQHPFTKKIQLWIKNNYDTAMRIVAYTELIIMFRVSVGAFLLQNSLLSPIFYAHFLRFRYYQSQFTQRAVARVKAEVDKFVTRPGSPPVLLSVWQNAQMIINRWAGSLLVQQPPPQQQQPAAAGRR